MRRDKAIAHYFLWIVLVMGLPLLGVFLSGGDICHLFQFPPQTRYVAHAPFSFPVFVSIAAVILLLCLPFILRASFYVRNKLCSKSSSSFFFPWWGYLGVTMILGFWILSWTRFAWFAPYQLYTFTPLWVGYILAVNALAVKRTGRCLMTERPKEFLALFPLSIIFWWIFEYLNRFTQNWYYIEVVHFTPSQYFFLASVSFSTVLPAILSTRRLLLSFSILDRAFSQYVRVTQDAIVHFLRVGFGVSIVGLIFIGPLQNHLFPLLWMAPLFIVAFLQFRGGHAHIFSPLIEGQWTMLVLAALSALICGFFWEMWNYYSQAKWMYTIPFVDKYHVFEMPVLGYAGYLPFGMECAVIGDLVLHGNTGKPRPDRASIPIS